MDPLTKTATATNCNDLNKFLDGQFSTDETVQFEFHLSKCPACSSALKQWQLSREAFVRYAKAKESAFVAPSTPNEVANIISRAKKHTTSATKPLSPPAVRIVWAAAAIVVVSLGMFIWNWMPSSALQKDDLPASPVSITQTSKPISVTYNFMDGTASRTGTLQPKDTVIAPADSQMLVSLGNDRIGLAPASKITVEEIGTQTKLFLQKGSAAFSVAKRAHGSFQVQTTNVQVIVIGTQFSVSQLDPGSVLVAVKKGKVRVSSLQGKQYLSVGQTAVIHGSTSTQRPSTLTELQAVDSLLFQKSKTSSLLELPNVETIDKQPERRRIAKPHQIQKNISKWKKLVATGQLTAAINQIQRYLQTEPNDCEALLLLATCRKKSGHFQQALQTYDRIIQYCNHGTTNRAQYLAGIICQTNLRDHHKATQYFSMYLDQSDKAAPNRAEAQFHLAHSLWKTSKHETAKKLLEEIVRSYQNLPIANRAAHLLLKIQASSQAAPLKRSSNEQ